MCRCGVAGYEADQAHRLDIPELLRATSHIHKCVRRRVVGAALCVWEAEVDVDTEIHGRSSKSKVLTILGLHPHAQLLSYHVGSKPDGIETLNTV